MAAGCGLSLPSGPHSRTCTLSSPQLQAGRQAVHTREGQACQACRGTSCLVRLATSPYLLRGK